MRFIAHRIEDGWTLLELLSVFLVIAIVGAITIPTLGALRNRSTLDQAATQVMGILKEAQRQSLQESISCRVVLTESAARTECPAGSLVRNDLMPSDVTLSSNLDTPPEDTIQFSFRGTIANLCPALEDCGTIQIQSDRPGQPPRCVRLENLLGKPKEIVCPS
jgi:type II secretory pathway pseudopilin PulG